MKLHKLFIAAIMLLFALSASYSQDVTTKTFTAGDTTVTVPVEDASAVFFTIRDSSMAGTDSIYIALRESYNGITFYSVIVLYDLSEVKVDTAGVSTYTSALVKPTDGLTKTYVWYPGAAGGVSGVKFTGDIYIARLNQPPTAAGYQPKTRIIVKTLK